MAFGHGSATDVYVGGYDLTGYLNAVTMAGQADVAETTTFGNTAKTYIPGLKDGTVQAEGYFDGVADAVDQVLAAALGAATVNWTVMPQGDTVGSPAKGFSTVGTSYEVESPVDGATTITAEGQSVVGMEKGLVAHALAARTANGTGTALDNSTSSASGGAGYLHVTAFSGFSGVVVLLEHSTDNVTYATLGTFATVDAARDNERIAFTGTVNRYVRAKWTVTGSGSITFHVTFVRK